MVTAARNILGHAHARASLEADLKAGNLAHAYLFAGPRHVGKLTVAHWFARTVLTQGKSPDEATETIRQLDHLIHPDLLVLDQLWMDEICDDWEVIAKTSNVPQEHRAKREPPMKTDTISIDDVRAIQERLHSTGSGTHRFCLIRSVERMQDEAANALLKILEEPPPGRIFILTTQQLEGLLPTVVSRCRVVHFSPLPHQELLPLLTHEPEEDRGLLLHLAQGAPGVLKRLLVDPDARRAEHTLHTAARSFYAEPRLMTRLKTLEPLTKRGPDGEALLRHLFLALREEPPAVRLRLTPALLAFAADLETNTHRGLLCTRFAMEAGIKGEDTKNR